MKAALFLSPLLATAYCLLPTPRAPVHRAAGEVALAVGEAQLRLLQLGVDHVDLHLAEGAVLRLVRGRVGDEVLRAQVFLNLREGQAQVVLVAREVGAPARPLGNLPKTPLVHALEAEAARRPSAGRPRCAGSR